MWWETVITVIFFILIALGVTYYYIKIKKIFLPGGFIGGFFISFIGAIVLNFLLMDVVNFFIEKFNIHLVTSIAGSIIAIKIFHKFSSP